MLLIYVDFFHWVARDPATDMWVIQWHIVQGQRGPQRVGAVVPLVDIMHAVELIPVYSEKVDRTVTYKTSQEIYSWFYLNTFADKEVY